MNLLEINMDIDIHNPLHAAAYKLAATHFLSSDHDDWSAVRLFNAITAHEDTDHWLESELDRQLVYPWKGIEACCSHPMCDPWDLLQEYMVSLAMDFVAFAQEQNTNPETTYMKTITLEQFHEILNDAYAVDVNDTLYFLGHDDDGPYVADNDGQDYVSLAEVDGDIEVLVYGFFFYVAGKAITLKPLGLLSRIEYLN